MPSKESEAVKRHWAAARLTSQLPMAEQPDRETADHAWAGLTSEPREVDYLSVGEGAFTTAEHPIWWTALALGLALLLLTHLAHRQAGEAVG